MGPLQAWWRFHGRPGWAQLSRTAAGRPGLFAAAGFLVVFWTVLAWTGNPLIRLPADPGAQAAAFLGLTALGALAALAAVRSSSTFRKEFFGPAPRALRQSRLTAAARAGLCWAAAEGAAGGLTGPGWEAWTAAGAAGLVFAGILGPWTWPRPGRGGTAGFLRRWPGPAAWWASMPGIYLLPFAVWAGALGALAAGLGGFSWSERPPVVGPLLAFGWPLAVALGTSGLGDRLPYRFFRAARAPFGRVAAVTAAPLAAQSLAAALVAAAGATGPFEGLTYAAVCLTGAAFWLAASLRFSSAGLVLLMGFGAFFAAGATLLAPAGLLWALVQGVGALVLAAGWRARYLEGETDADH